MNTRLITILLICAAVLVIAAFIVAGRSGGPTAPPDTAAATPLFPDLAARSGDIAGVTLIRGTTTVRMAREGDAWTLPDKGGFPADAGKILTLLSGLARASVVETKTANPDLYSRLGVDHPGKTGAAGVLIRVTDKDGSLIAGVILGNRAQTSAVEAGSARQGRYARREGENQSLLVAMQVEAEPDAMSWVNRLVSDIKADDIQSLRVTRPDPAGGEPHVITISRERAADVAFTLSPMPEGRTLRDENAPRRSAVSLSFVNAEDVRPAAEVPGDAPATISEFRRFDGLTIRVRTVDVEGKPWCLFEAVAPAPPAPEPPPDDAVKPNQPADTAEPHQPPPAADRPAALVKEASDLNAKWSAWAYALPQFKVEQIAPTLESLLAPLAPPESPPGPSPMGPEPPPAGSNPE